MAGSNRGPRGRPIAQERPRERANRGVAGPSAGPTTARGVAVAVLVAAEEGARANVELPRVLGRSRLDERDRGFATELCYGSLRMLRACDWLISRFVSRPLEPSVRAAARVGAYQLAFLRVPKYAAVSATVEEGPPRARSLLNAVLRRVGDLVEEGPIRWPDVATRLSYPDWVLERLVEDLGKGPALAALEQMNEPAAPRARPDGYIQDLGSEMVAEHMSSLLGMGPEAPVIDLCAAPGGKATLLARTAALVVAADRSAPRTAMVVANAARLGEPNVAVVVADGTAAPFRGSSASGVLVDAPCTGLGALRRRPDARWRVRPGDVPRLAELQGRLLDQAASLVAPGGVLVFSVCTLTRAETLGAEERLSGAGGMGGSWSILPPPGPPWEPLGRGALLLPHAAGTDGMYMLVLRRER